MVARPCRSRTRAYTAEGAHPGLRRCRLSPCPGGVLASGALGATSRVRPQPLVVPPGCAHTLPVSSSPAPASEGPGISAPSPTIRSGGLHGQTCQGPGALHFYYSGCYLLSAFYFPGVQFKYCYVILFYLCKP